MTAVRTPAEVPAVGSASLWRASPRRLVQLLLGLWVFGTGEACIVAADVGNSPWTVLAQGISLNTPFSVGAATVAVSFVVLMLWIPLRQRPGLGTLMNAVVVGVAIDVMLPVVDPGEQMLPRIALMLAGIAVVALGSGLYLTCRLGPGPRDGLMTGLSRRTGRSLRFWRTAIELTALTAGFLLGGVVGLGTVAFALLIGPGVQAAVGLVDRGDPRPL